MNKEKQIEEMKEIVCDVLNFDICNKFDRCSDCPALGIIEALYNAGYRKQSEEKKTTGCEYCKGRAYTKKPLTVITKYGRRIELVFEFCPNCGRKMKGGADK